MANIKAGTQIINVAASGETPKISASKSLIALINHTNLFLLTKK